MEYSNRLCVLMVWLAAGGRWCGICKALACRACSSRAQQHSLRGLTAWPAAGGGTGVGLRADGLVDGRWAHWCGICKGLACRACSRRVQYQSLLVLRAWRAAGGRAGVGQRASIENSGLQSLQQESTATESESAHGLTAGRAAGGRAGVGQRAPHRKLWPLPGPGQPEDVGAAAHLQHVARARAGRQCARPRTI